jgi:hypothetical protein
MSISILTILTLQQLHASQIADHWWIDHRIEIPTPGSVIGIGIRVVGFRVLKARNLS